jgi:hypothetical protein
MWRRLSPAEFNEQYLTVYESIFTGVTNGPTPFVRADWKTVLLAYGLNFDDPDYAALAAAAKAVDDREAVLTDIDIEPFHQDAHVVDWDRDSLDHVAIHSLLTVLACAMFGRTASWGVVCYFENYACVGGDKEFMDIFIDEAGGETALRERFLQFAHEGWVDKPAHNQWLELVDPWLEKVGWS